MKLRGSRLRYRPLFRTSVSRLFIQDGPCLSRVLYSVGPRRSSLLLLTVSLAFFIPFLLSLPLFAVCRSGPGGFSWYTCTFFQLSFFFVGPCACKYHIHPVAWIGGHRCHCLRFIEHPTPLCREPPLYRLFTGYE
ncbi:hypothetical protein F4861DRAFT_382250 [Xylaria intraflava]|nr:hypothetical protein F4861DRAFT_382250 [Xylaria intraflava]